MDFFIVNVNYCRFIHAPTNLILYFNITIFIIAIIMIVNGCEMKMNAKMVMKTKLDGQNRY